MSRIDRRLRSARIAKRVGGDVAFQVAAYAEAVVYQILEDAGLAAEQVKAKKLSQVHIASAIRSNPDLARLYSAFSITSMNDMPKPMKHVLSKKELEDRKRKAEARKKAQEEAEAKRKKELEAEEKRKQEEADRRAAEEAARHEAIVSHLEDDTDKGEHVDVTAQNKQIAAIMRDQTLSAVEKQMRTQAIRAGKLDVPAAPSDTTGAAKSAGAVAGDAGSAQWLPPGRPQAPQQMQHSPPRQQQFAAASATLPAAN